MLAESTPALGMTDAVAPVDEFRLVDETPVTVPDPLADNRIYVKQKSNAFFATEPSVLHFAGFKVGRKHMQTLRIKNISGTSRRLHILQPTTPYFQIKMQKIGLVAPGMSEEVTVEFTPSDLRYYYDCIRLHTQDENLVVPCHGYPVMNELELPKRVEFGSCPINDVKFETIDLECKTPINFEYELTVVEPHPEISVTPLKGTVPALGSAQIEVRYRPTTFRTATMKFQVRLSQFGFEPKVITVTGNCQPGQLKDSALADTAATRLGQSEKVVMSVTRESFGRAAGQTTGSIGAGSNHFSADDGAELGLTGGGGGGRQDPVSAHRAARQRLERSQRVSETGGGAGKIQAKPPNFRPPSPDQTVEGILFPPDLSNHAAIANVMTQEAGKLKIKDLKKAIDEAKRKAEADAEKLENTSLEDAADGDGMGRQLKETVFQREFGRVEEFERSKEIKWFICVGDQNMTPEEIQQVEADRNKKAAARKHALEAEDRARKETQVLPDRPVFPHNVAPANGPSWNLNTDDAAVRKFGLERFQDAARVVIIHNRVNFRLFKLRSLWEKIGKDMEAVGDLVDKWDDVEAVQKIIGDPSGDRIDDQEARVSIRFSMDTCQRFAFPTYRESEFADLQPLDNMPTIPFFEEADTFPLMVPLEADMMGYKVWDLPISPFDFPSDRTPAERVGAEEESVIRAACRVDAPVQELLDKIHSAGPPENLDLPVVPKPFTHVPMYLKANRYPENASDYVLRPDRPLKNPEQAMANQLGGDSVVVSENATREADPMLSSIRRPYRDHSIAVVTRLGTRAPLPAFLDGPIAEALALGNSPDPEPETEPQADPESELEPETDPVADDEFLKMVTSLAADATPFDSARQVASKMLSGQSYAKRSEQAELLANRVAAVQAAVPLLQMNMNQ
jgi:hypothetical protein